eukprot:7585505-Karenia_brevis.AAC.1
MPAHAHSWSYNDGKWACKACLKVASTEGAKRRCDASNCRGYAPSLARVLQHPNGHRLSAAETTGGAVV